MFRLQFEIIPESLYNGSLVLECDGPLVKSFRSRSLYGWSAYCGVHPGNGNGHLLERVVLTKHATTWQGDPTWLISAHSHIYFHFSAKLQSSLGTIILEWSVMLWKPRKKWIGKLLRQRLKYIKQGLVYNALQ